MGARAATKRAVPAGQRGAAGFEPTDWLCLVYHGALFLVLATAGPAGRLAEWRFWALGHLATVVAIVALVLRRPSRGPLALLRRWYPVLSLLWLYGEVGALRHLVVAADLDPWVARLDATIFGGAPHLALPRLLPAAGLEALHGIYASYYLLLFLPGLLAGAREERSVRRYIAVLNATMLAHYVVGMLLPVSGPVALRAQVIPAGSFFIPIMDRLYGLFDRGGMALPSTHVVASILAAAFAARWFPRGRWFFSLLATAIAFSTVACCYHYTLDVVAGVATGFAALALERASVGKPASARSRPRRVGG